MTYLADNNERYMLRLLVERPKMLAKINPWWFYDDISKHVAWGIYKAERDAKEWTIDTIHDILEDRNINKTLIDAYLNIQLPDPSILDDIVNYFILTSQIFEIAEKDLKKNKLSKKEYDTLRAITEKLKQYKWNAKVIEYVSAMYIKVTDDRTSKQLAIAKRRAKLSKRFE